MQVVHLVPSVGPLSGGMGAVSMAMLAEQRRAGLDATLWCVDLPKVAAAEGPPNIVVPLPVMGPRRFARSPAGERLARVSSVDVVHQHGLWTAQSRITETFRRRGTPTLIAPHGSLEPGAFHHSAWKKRIALAWFESRNLHLASCLHATSADELKTFRSFGLRSPVAIIANGVTPEWVASSGNAAAFRQRHQVPSGKRVMLFLSRLHAKKGLPLLIEALTTHQEQLRGWEVVVAGTDEHRHRAEIERHARRRGVADMVRFVGPVYDQEKRDAYAAADLFVLPTHTENFGIVIAEALACGVPVLTTHGAPWSELETHRCGWWVPIDAGAIGAALVDAAGRPASELKAMGERGRDLVASRYLWPEVAAETIALYRWLCGSGERPSFVVVD